MAATQPPPEFFQRVPLRPGEILQGFLPNLLSMVIPIQGGKQVVMGHVHDEMTERPTDLVVTDQRMMGYKFEAKPQGFSGRPVVDFYPRFGFNVENAQEIHVKDNRLQVMCSLNSGGLATVYVITGGSREAEGLAQWLEFTKKKRLELLQKNRPPPEAVAMPSHERRLAGGWSNAPPPPPPPPPPPGY